MASAQPGPIVDSGLLAPGWAGTGVDALVSDESWVRAMLDVEVALARAQADLGIVPPAVVDTIAAAARSARLDLTRLAAGVHATANPIGALVTEFTAAVSALDPDAADYVHRGGTSQDILDSAMMLVCARTMTHLTADLTRCADALATLVNQHRETPMTGRTLTQHAVPVTFGLKAAGWLQLVLDARHRIHRVLDGGLPASLGGAAGTLAAYAEYATQANRRGAIELLEPFARHLGLAVPLVPWHAIRTPVADVAGTLAFTCGALGKFAIDVEVLTRTEIGEVTEPAAPGRGTSSAMPQKRNPVYATLITTAARQVPNYATILFASVAVEDERSAGGWHAEWHPLRECLRLTAGAAQNAADLAAGLTVHPDRMRDNLALTGAALVSERLSAVLTPIIGKAPAKKLLTRIIDESSGSTEKLVDLLTKALAGHDPDALNIRELLDPTGYLGDSVALADRVLARHRAENDTFMGAPHQ